MFRVPEVEVLGFTAHKVLEFSVHDGFGVWGLGLQGFRFEDGRGCRFKTLQGFRQGSYAFRGLGCLSGRGGKGLQGFGV